MKKDIIVERKFFKIKRPLLKIIIIFLALLVSVFLLFLALIFILPETEEHELTYAFSSPVPVTCFFCNNPETKFNVDLFICFDKKKNIIGLARVDKRGVLRPRKPPWPKIDFKAVGAVGIDKYF